MDEVSIRAAIARFVQGLKDDGTWDLVQSSMMQGAAGPLNKQEMERIWQDFQSISTPTTTEATND